MVGYFAGWLALLAANMPVAFTLGVTQDLVLLVAAAVALLVMVRGRAAATPHSASASR